MKNLYTLLLLILLTSSYKVSAEPQCLDNSTDYLALDFIEFDQTLGQGWRAVADKPECQKEAANLIQQYAEQKEGLSEGMLSTLRWHEGQMRAVVGQNEKAIALFKQTFKPEKSDRMGWNYYVGATIAFLGKDKQALLENRSKLAQLEKPEDMDMRDADGNPVDIQWPPNLHIVDRFVSCFGRSYSDTYANCEAEVSR